jgi:hypothetical protein
MDSYKETALKILASERLYFHPEIYTRLTDHIELNLVEDEGSLSSRGKLIENITGLLSNKFDLNIVNGSGVISIINEYPVKIEIKTYRDRESSLWYFINFYAKIGESENIPKDVVNIINNFVSSGIVLWDGDSIIYTNGYSFKEENVTIPLLHFIYKSFLIFSVESEEILLNSNSLFDYKTSKIDNWALDDIKASLESYAKKLENRNLRDLITINNINESILLIVPLPDEGKQPLKFTLTFDRVDEGRIGLMIHGLLPLRIKRNKVASLLQKLNAIPHSDSKIEHTTLWLAGQWYAKNISGDRCNIAYKYFLNAEYKDIIDIESHLEGVIRELYKSWAEINFLINFDSLVSGVE